MITIIGAGITGASAAYYLSFLSKDITIIDALGPGKCASGNAGAYLSKIWGDDTKTEKFHRQSFQLHEELAFELNLKSFRYLPTFFASEKQDNEEDDNVNEAIPWLDGMQHRPSETNNGTPTSSAQVDPAELTNALLNKAIERGAQLRIANVNGLESKNGRTTKILFEDENIQNDFMEIGDDEEDVILIAMGPWTCRLEDWLKIPLPIEGIKSSFILWDQNNIENDLSERTKTQYINPLVFEHPVAVFCDEDSNGCHLEIIPRLESRSLYVSGLGTSSQLSPSVLRGSYKLTSFTDSNEISKEMKASSSGVKAALKSLKEMGIVKNIDLCDLKDEQFKTKACIRPVSPDGIPIVGKLNSNVYVASGGGQWWV